MQFYHVNGVRVLSVKTKISLHFLVTGACQNALYATLVKGHNFALVAHMK